MGKIVFSFIITGLLILLVSNAYGQDMEDVVYLKNGSIIHGTIIEQVPYESIKIKTKDGNIFVYKMEEVEKMTKEEIIEKSEPKETPSTLKLKEGSIYKSSGFGIRAGIGTDITLGIGFGMGVFYVASTYSSPDWDLGIDIYYANVSDEETDYEGTRWEENTKVLVFALRSNALFNYHPRKTGVYFVAGAGIVITNVSWEETYTYNPPIYPYSVEHYSNDGIAFGNVLNLGVGLTFGGGLEARLETPLLIFYNTPGKASGIAPTFTLNVLYRFP